MLITPSRSVWTTSIITIVAIVNISGPRTTTHRLDYAVCTGRGVRLAAASICQCLGSTGRDNLQQRYIRSLLASFNCAASQFHDRQ
jgi:hypothetical protein